MNGYRVHLQRLAGGFTTTVVVGEVRSEDERLHVADDFTYSWGFEDEFAPNPMEPSTVQFRLVARSRTDLPTLDVGDLWSVVVDLVDVTDDLTTDLVLGAIEFVGRLGEPEVELIPTHSWPIRVSLVLVDLLADLRSRFPQPGLFPPNPSFPEGGPESLGYASDWLMTWTERVAFLNLWFPTKYSTDAQVGFQLRGDIVDESAYNQLARIAASWPSLAGQLATTRWRYANTNPDPATYEPAGFKPYGFGNFPDLANPVGYVMQFVERRLPDSAALPYVLTGPAGGPISTALDLDPSEALGIAVLAGRHVTIPTNARRSRDQQPNTFVLSGTQRNYSNTEEGFIVFEDIDTTLTITEDASAPRSRGVDTGLRLRQVDYRIGEPEPTLVNNELTRARLEAGYKPDVAALQDEWIYDRLQVDTRNMTSDEFAAVVPMLTSCAPEHLDGVALRQVIVAGIDPDVDLSGRDRIVGRLVAGAVRIAGGRLTYELQLAPGVLEAGGSAITAAQLAAGPYATSTPAAFGDLTALDMRLVRA